MSRLGVIVPYRDREEQLKRFVPYMKQYFEDINLRDYEIIVVEQADAKEFNRGALLNIGFIEAERLGCDYVAFHDLDMLPVNVDYSYTSSIVQVARHFKPKFIKIPYDYLGGVTLCPMDVFKRIGGYSNEYWGWGYEDNDLLLRCIESRECTNYVRFKQPTSSGPAIHFNGKSYIEFSRPVSFKNSCLFYVDFVLDRLPVDLKNGHDESSIFCIPGLDITLAYDSFGTYKFEVFDEYEDVYSIHSDKLPAMHCKVVVYYSKELGEIRVYLNDKLVGVKPIRQGRKIKVVSDKLYLGTGSPGRGDRKSFIGDILQFVVVDRCTEEMFSDILYHGIDTVDRQESVLWIEGKNYDESEGQVVDESRIGQEGRCVRCEITNIPERSTKRIPVPCYRNGEFRLQKHEGNGAEDGHWKCWSTRLNQYRYYRRSVVDNTSERGIDGLVNIRQKFKWKLREIEDNYYIVKAKSLV